MTALSTRTFGIELEIMNLNCRQAAAVIQMAGVAATAEGYNHSTRSHWKVVTDATVSGGCEVVSPVLSGEAGLAEIRKVCAALEAAGATVNRNCGYHLHFGARNFSTNELKNIAKMWFKYEAAIDLILPRSRRAANGGYCRSNGANFDYDVDRAFEAIDTATDFDSLSRVINPHCGNGSRYHKLNLQSFFRHGTIEFRAHSGTANGEKVTNWIILIDAMISEACAARTIKLPSAAVQEMNAADRIKNMCRGFGVSTAVTRYYINRANEFTASGNARRTAA